MSLLLPSEHFPPAEDADPEGLVGFESAEPEAIILDFEQIGEIPY
jgi:hypothetical protein